MRGVGWELSGVNGHASPETAEQAFERLSRAEETIPRHSRARAGVVLDSPDGTYLPCLVAFRGRDWAEAVMIACPPMTTLTDAAAEAAHHERRYYGRRGWSIVESDGGGCDDAALAAKVAMAAEATHAAFGPGTPLGPSAGAGWSLAGGEPMIVLDNCESLAIASGSVVRLPAAVGFDGRRGGFWAPPEAALRTMMQCHLSAVHAGASDAAKGAPLVGNSLRRRLHDVLDVDIASLDADHTRRDLERIELPESLAGVGLSGEQMLAARLAQAVAATLRQAGIASCAAWEPAQRDAHDSLDESVARACGRVWMVPATAWPVNGGSVFEMDVSVSCEPPRWQANRLEPFPWAVATRRLQCSLSAGYRWLDAPAWRDDATAAMWRDSDAQLVEPSATRGPELGMGL